MMRCMTRDQRRLKRGLYSYPLTFKSRTIVTTLPALVRNVTLKQENGKTLLDWPLVLLSEEGVAIRYYAVSPCCLQ